MWKWLEKLKGRKSEEERFVEMIEEYERKIELLRKEIAGLQAGRGTEGMDELVVRQRLSKLQADLSVLEGLKKVAENELLLLRKVKNRASE